jgi:hypothetical protein
MSAMQPVLYTESVIPNIQSNTKTKYDRVIMHIKLQTILFETYDILLHEDAIIVKGVKTQKYKDVLQSVNDQRDILLNIYGHDYDNECYTDQFHMMDNYYKPPRIPWEPFFKKENVFIQYIENVFIQ